MKIDKLIRMSVKFSVQLLRRQCLVFNFQQLNGLVTTIVLLSFLIACTEKSQETANRDPDMSKVELATPLKTVYTLNSVLDTTRGVSGILAAANDSYRTHLVSVQSAANRFSINLTKQRSILLFA